MKFKNCELWYHININRKIKMESNICLVCLSPNRAHIQTAIGQFRSSVIIWWHWLLLYCVFWQNKYRSLILHTAESMHFFFLLLIGIAIFLFSYSFTTFFVSSLVWLLLVVWCWCCYFVSSIHLLSIYYGALSTEYWGSNKNIARTSAPAAAAWWPKTVGAQYNIYAFQHSTLFE